MKLKDLNEQERAALMQELKAEEKKKEVQIQEERKRLKEMQSIEVNKMFDLLTKTSSLLSITKKEVFDNFKSLIELKCEVYQVRDSQQSHTFSNAEGNKRITLGHRVLDKYDETADAGVSKVKEYVESLATNAETAKLVDMINSLLKRDQKGDLKANRVLDLYKLAKDSDSDLFKDGVQIIMDAHRPEKSSSFIEASWKDEHGWNNVALSISSAEFPKESNENTKESDS
jgi:hypothetical protein